MRFLLDTNILLELAKHAPHPAVTEWAQQQSPLDLAISVLTLGELTKGAQSLTSGDRRSQVREWIANELPRQFSGRVLHVDAAVANEWGRLSAEAKARGRELPVIDGILLATASVHRLVFATRNESDCAARGVEILNPWSS